MTQSIYRGPWAVVAVWNQIFFWFYYIRENKKANFYIVPKGVGLLLIRYL